MSSKNVRIQNNRLLKNCILLYSIILLTSGFRISCYSQQGPWNSPLRIAWSKDGRTFGASSVFQDSAGVPCVIKWKGDTLIAAFQWFRQPNPSPSWDRIAVKFSYDKGQSWSTPVPVAISGLPSTFQRPFDPTLTVFGSDSIRLYFSSSDGIPKAGLDSSINSYSAYSLDGVHYVFEPDARVDVINNRVIDPAVIYFNKSWHYAAPAGAPQDGAYHYVSGDGLRFIPVPKIPSDNTHNWTGNYMVESENELRFYGSGPWIWYNSSPNGGIWNGFIQTNVRGGDPSVLKLNTENYLMIYVGQPYSTSTTNPTQGSADVHIYPNPADENLYVSCNKEISFLNYSINDISGRLRCKGYLMQQTTNLPLNFLEPGLYHLILYDDPPIRIPFLKMN